MIVVRFYRVKVNPIDFAAEKEVLLLQPVSFALIIKRNLSTAWFTAIPDIDMSGRLKKIELSISQEDYATIMRVLSENLGETIDDPEYDVAQISEPLAIDDWNRQQSSERSHFYFSCRFETRRIFKLSFIAMFFHSQGRLGSNEAVPALRTNSVQGNSHGSEVRIYYGQSGHQLVYRRIEIGTFLLSNTNFFQ